MIVLVIDESLKAVFNNVFEFNFARDHGIWFDGPFTLLLASVPQ